MPEQHVPVLIAGGGTVGLSAALFLAHHGVPALAVERRAGISIHPRALGVGVRSVEIFREMGLEEPVSALGGRLAAGRGGSRRETWPARTGHPSPSGGAHRRLPRPIPPRP
jgi:2-polyprenyl-6-methoxyphenol hydroxylase-like FAD-dependent oxidoreductase